MMCTARMVAESALRRYCEAALIQRKAAARLGSPSGSGFPLPGWGGYGTGLVRNPSAFHSDVGSGD
jgi:hypothetical protein